MNLALFDLDHTLLPLDSDYEWGQFLVSTGAVDAVVYAERNAAFFAQYQASTLDPVEYLEFSLGTLAQFPRQQLDAWHAEFMAKIIQPAILPAARDLLQKHQDAGDLIVMITATNRFVTEPIARALGVEHLIAALPETTPSGELTGKLLGTPTSGPGKVTHTHAWLASMGTSLDQFEKSYFYSDSQNDIPLLSIVTHPVVTNPSAALEAHAKAHGWPLLRLFDEAIIK